MPDLSSDVSDGIALVTLNRPDRLNAFTPGMVDDLLDLLRRLDQDPEVRAIVLTGAGSAFSSGADTTVLEGDSGAGIDEFVRAMAPGPELIGALRTPVIAAIRGAAIGLGLAIALAADVRVVAVDARLCLPFSRLGAVAEFASAWYLSRLVGIGHALDMLLSGRFVTGEEAARIGLAQHCRPDDEVLPFALDYARTLAEACSPTSLHHMRRMVTGSLEESLSDHLAGSLPLVDATPTSPDFLEAMAARRDRRPPMFTPVAGSGSPLQTPSWAARLQAVERCVEAWNSRDVDAILACYTDDVLYSDPGTDGEVKGHAALRRYLEACFSVWAEITVTLKETHGTDDSGVVALWDVTMRAKDQDRRITVSGMDYLEIQPDLRISRDIAENDRLPFAHAMTP